MYDPIQDKAAQRTPMWQSRAEHGDAGLFFFCVVDAAGVYVCAGESGVAWALYVRHVCVLGGLWLGLGLGMFVWRSMGYGGLSQVSLLCVCMFSGVLVATGVCC